VIVDAHVHVFPPQFIAERSQLSQSEPVFGWMYGDPQARMAAVAELIQVLDAGDIHQAVVCGFPWRETGRARDHNQYILDAAGQHPDRLIPLAAVDPTGPGSTTEAQRALREGAAGLGEIGAYQYDLDEPEVLQGIGRLAGLCAESDKPMLLHANEPVGHSYPGKSPMTLRGLYALLKSCPDTRFQLAHLGGGIFMFELMKKEVRQVLSGCVFDTAAAPFLYRPELYPQFITLAGPERLLFGSDFPLLRLERYQRDIQAAGLDSEARDRILGGNARAFWNL
jgi:predicted TIM-barrel fold metal-dependent hydrolase